MKISDSDYKLLKEMIKAMDEGKLTRREKIIFVTGTMAGMHSDEIKVREQLNKLAELCLAPDVDFEEVDNFDN